MDQLCREAPVGKMGGAPGVGNALWTPESESAGTSECSQDSEAHWLPFRGFPSPPTRAHPFFQARAMVLKVWFLNQQHH